MEKRAVPSPGLRTCVRARPDLQADEPQGEGDGSNPEEETKVYEDIACDNVILLSEEGGGGESRLQRSERVLAVYPDTTAFYKGTVTCVPKHRTGNAGTYYSVQFDDDADLETMITPDRSVAANYVVRA